MIIVDFQVENKIGRLRFFQEIFLIANIKFEIVLKMFFLKISNVNMLFDKKHLRRDSTLLIRLYSASLDFS